MSTLTYLWEEGLNITTSSFLVNTVIARGLTLNLIFFIWGLTYISFWKTHLHRDKYGILWRLHLFFQVDPSPAMVSSILFKLSSVPVLAITVLSWSKPLVTGMVGTLTIPNEEAACTPLVVLQLETLKDKEIWVELFIDRNERDILHWLAMSFHRDYRWLYLKG